MAKLTEEQRKDIVDRIAHRIRRKYALWRCRRQRISSFRPKSEKWTQACWKAALLCLEHDVNPDEFVEVQFLALKPWPHITALCSSAAVKRFYEHRKEHATRVVENVVMQSKAFEKLIRVGYVDRDVLLDPEENYDALFIYITAKERGLDDIAEKYFKTALVEYLLTVHYDPLYGDLIPEELKKAAEEVWETESWM